MIHPALAEALAKLEWDYEQSDAHAGVSFSDLRSGGVVTKDDEWPLLAATPELAVETFLAALRTLAVHPHLCWAERPKLYSFNVTVADGENRHRVIAQRYAVRGLVKSISREDIQKMQSVA